MNIDYSNYNTEELFQALESVDDYEYRENAIRLYKLILKRLKLDFKSVTAKSLGYEITDAGEMAYMGISNLPFQGILTDLNSYNKCITSVSG